MNLTQLVRHSLYRVRSPSTSVRYEIALFVRQVKATACQHMHLISEARQRRWNAEQKAEEHGVLDYPDPDGADSYHTVIGCMCGKEWS